MDNEMMKNTPKSNERRREKTPWEKTWEILQKIWHVIKIIVKWIFNLRGIWLCIPVAIAALRLAALNRARLPAEVGINLLANGEYQYLISRDLAVTAPLLVTAVCLVMMLLSRRTIYPWIISIFSLVLPLLIWVTNVFPG
jgi:hypothetical protein